MRRVLALTTAVILSYCLMDALARDGGEAAGHTGAPIFWADIAPIDDVSAVARGNDSQASVAEAVAPSSATVAATSEANFSAEKPAVQTAPVVAPAQSKIRTAVVAPHPASRHALKPIAAAPATEPSAATYVAPVVERSIAIAQRGATTGGCSGGRLSQPDAAGVPVLVCN